MIDAIVIQQLQLPAYDDEIVTDRCTSDFTWCKLEVGRLTEKPNRYRIFLKTDTDTDFGILKTEKYRIPTQNNRKNRYSRLFSFLSSIRMGNLE